MLSIWFFEHRMRVVLFQEGEASLFRKDWVVICFKMFDKFTVVPIRNLFEVFRLQMILTVLHSCSFWRMRRWAIVVRSMAEKRWSSDESMDLFSFNRIVYATHRRLCFSALRPYVFVKKNLPHIIVIRRCSFEKYWARQPTFKNC